MNLPALKFVIALKKGCVYMQADFTDYKQELTLFLIELLKNIDLSKFKTDNSNSLERYINVSLKHKYFAMAKSINEEQQNISSDKNKDILEILTSNPSKNFETNFHKIELFDDLNCLSKKQKVVIVYKYIHRFSDEEIAKILGTTRQAVNRIKNRAFKTLKEYYK